MLTSLIAMTGIYLSAQPPAPVPGVAIIPPRLSSGSITDDDYPREAYAAEVEGPVTAQLSINPQGRVAACEIALSSGFEVLDTATCSLMRQRFRYEPPLDATGRATSFTTRQRITWRLPSESRPRIAVGLGRLTWSVTADPREVRSCAVEHVGVSFAALTQESLCNASEYRRLVSTPLISNDRLPRGIAAVRVRHVLTLTPLNTAASRTATAGLSLPTGQLPPLPPENPKVLLQAELELAEAGHALTCRIIGRSGTAPTYITPLFPYLCDTVRNARRPRFTRGSNGVRGVRLEIATYIDEVPLRASE